MAFSLYRSQDPASLGQLLAMLPAQGDGLTGAAYSYRDSDVLPGVLYNYTLAQVTTSGELITVATATAKVGVPTQTPTATRTPSPTLSSTATPTKTPTLTPATGGITDVVWLDANGDGERDVDELELGSVRLVLR